MKKILVSLVFLFAIAPAGAQQMQFQQGKKYFMGGEYLKALEFFNQAISQERSGDKALLTEAYYLRGLTWIRLHGEAYADPDDAEGQKKYADALLSAYRDFKSSLKFDEGSYWSKIDIELKNLHHPLLQEGLKSLNDHNDLVFNGKSDTRQLQRASDYLEAAHEIRDSYLVNDLLGQVALNRAETVAAKTFFLHSADLYEASLPEEPDFLMAYVFYRLAALYKTDSIRTAMQIAQRGVNLIEKEHFRLLGMKDELRPDRVQQLEEQYRLAANDLKNLKLDLYVSDPSLYIEAVHVFEEELLNDPKNPDLLIGYASLLEKTDKTKAIETYKAALAVDSMRVVALFNLGALIYGNSRDLFDLAQKTTDDSQFSVLMEEAVAGFEEARPYFEKALALEPQSLPTIRALKTIAFVLDDRNAYETYKALEVRYDKN